MKFTYQRVEKSFQARYDGRKRVLVFEMVSSSGGEGEDKRKALGEMSVSELLVEMRVPMVEMENALAEAQGVDGYPEQPEDLLPAWHPDRQVEMPSADSPVGGSGAGPGVVDAPVDGRPGAPPAEKGEEGSSFSVESDGVEARSLEAAAGIVGAKTLKTAIGGAGGRFV